MKRVACDAVWSATAAKVAVSFVLRAGLAQPMGPSRSGPEAAGAASPQPQRLQAATARSHRLSRSKSAAHSKPRNKKISALRLGGPSFALLASLPCGTTTRDLTVHRKVAVPIVLLETLRASCRGGRSPHQPLQLGSTLHRQMAAMASLLARVHSQVHDLPVRQASKVHKVHLPPSVVCKTWKFGASHRGGRPQHHSP